MLRFFSRPLPLVLFLAIGTAIPVLSALVQVFQIPTGSYAPDSARLAVAPLSWFAHVLAGAAFGICGPVQFVRALRLRFGRLHRVLGRVFVISGLFLGFSGLCLLLQVQSVRTPIAETVRGLFGLGLLLTLAMAMLAIRNRDVARHRAWMIRAYATGMGVAGISLLFFPLYLFTGQAPSGLAADLLFVGSWALIICGAEVIVRRSATSHLQVPA